MENIYVLEEKVKSLELQLMDSNNKLNLNRQYSDTLEEEISVLNNKNIDYDCYILAFIIFILVFMILVLYKKNLVLSNSNKSKFKCDKFIVR